MKIIKPTRRELLKYGVKAGIIAFGVPTLLRFMETEARAAVTRENQAVSVDTTDDLASKTISYTCTGSDLVLVVGIGILGAVFTDHLDSGFGGGVTYNGVAMTRKQAASLTAGSEQLYIYTLNSPATGTHDVVVTFSTNSPNEVFWGIASFTGASGIGNSVIRREASLASPFNDLITVSAGSVAVDWCCMNYKTGFAVGAGQTQIGSTQGDGGFTNFAMSERLNATAMEWSWTSGDNGRGVHSIVEVQAAGAPATPTVQHRMIQW